MRKDTILLFCLTVIISGVVYVITICPTVEFIDSGELALACKYLGIAHPTGYPLYTLLGNLAAKIPIGSLILRENILSLLFTAFASGFFFLFISQLLKRYGDSPRTKVAAAIVASFTALSPVWWSQGTTNEVYSLNLLLIPISLWALFKFAMPERGGFRWLALSLYTFGLCLANHLSAVYVFPGMAYIIISELWKRRPKLSVLWPLAIFLLMPVTLYIFLPIRAEFRPFLNWGNVNDPYFFYKHVTGWQYRVWMFTNPLGIFEHFSEKAGPAMGLIYNQFKWYGLPLIIIGIAVSWRRYRNFLIFSILIWLLNLIYVLNYDINDIESYYLPLILVSSTFIAIAIFEIMRILEAKGKRAFSLPILLILALLPIAHLITNFHEADRSNKRFARQGVEDLAQSIEQNGIVIVENWDFYAPWLYMSLEENFRPDMILFDKELMRRSWYIDFIGRQYPDIYEHSKAAFEEFLAGIDAFDRDRYYNPYTLDDAYYGMFNTMLKSEIPHRPVYTNVFTDKMFIKGRPLIPSGIAFKYDNPEIFHEMPKYEFREDFWGDPRIYKDKRVAYLLSYYSRAFESRQKYCRYFGKTDEAEYYGKLADLVKAVVSTIDIGELAGNSSN